MKKLLVPIDFGEPCQIALDFSMKIARKYNLEVILVNVIQSAPNLSYGSSAGHIELTDENNAYVSYIESLSQEAKEKLNSILKKFQDYNVSVINEVIEGPLGKMIDSLAHKHDVDLMIMGSSGVHNIVENVLGSNAENVARKTDIPVLIIKHEVSDDIERVVFGTDFSDWSIRLFPTILGVVNFFNAQLDVVYINSVNHFRTTNELELEFEDFKNEFRLTSDVNFTIYNAKSTSIGLIEFAEKKNASFIALASHGRSPLSKLINGSVSEVLIEYAPNPLLTIRPAA